MPDVVKSESQESSGQAVDPESNGAPPAATPRPISPEELAEIREGAHQRVQETVERMNQRFRDNPNLQVPH